MIQSLSRLVRRQQPRVHADDVRTLESLACAIERDSQELRNCVAYGLTQAEPDLTLGNERVAAIRRVIRAVTE